MVVGSGKCHQRALGEIELAFEFWIARFFNDIEFEDELADEGGDTETLDDGEVLKQSGDVLDKLFCWLADSSFSFE